jgi:hypothetical protein
MRKIAKIQTVSLAMVELSMCDGGRMTPPFGGDFTTYYDAAGYPVYRTARSSGPPVGV